jgi:general secretion pathway protein M
MDVQDANRVVVAFGAVAFADWLGWVASLGSQQVRLSACRIEALPEPGMVGVTATLQRAK